MESFETSATVEGQGEVHVVGVPFAPGTHLRITMNATERSQTAEEDQALSRARDRMRELFSTIQGFRGASRLSREELYDRNGLR
jgi:hypothetical protein